MRSVRMKWAGLFLSWAALAVWFGSAVFHLALHPEHGHAASAAHAHGDCGGHGHGHLPEAPAVGDAGLERGAAHSESGIHGDCALCALASVPALFPVGASAAEPWLADSAGAAVPGALAASSRPYDPQSRRGPPSNA